MAIDFDKFRRKLDRLQRYVERDMPRIIGIESANFFSENFDRQGFLDNGLKKWKKPKRTDPNSPWYGFQYRARTKLPSNHPRRRGAKKPYKPRKANPITNFSPAATKKPTLVNTGRLANSIDFRIISPKKVEIYSDVPYAAVHNYGGTIKIFGRKTTRVPQRRFMGPSAELNRKIKKIIEQDIKRIMK